MSPIPMKLSEGGHGLSMAGVLFLIYIWAASMLLMVMWIQARYGAYWTEPMNRMRHGLELRIEILNREEQAENEPNEGTNTVEGYINVD